VVAKVIRQQLRNGDEVVGGLLLTGVPGAQPENIGADVFFRAAGLDRGLSGGDLRVTHLDAASALDHRRSADLLIRGAARGTSPRTSPSG
jgi:hypothetical protein